MSNKQTALQKSISQLKQQKDILKNHFQEGKWNDDKCSEIENCIFILESNLEMEKEQIINFANDYFTETNNIEYTNAVIFFNQTYEHTTK